MKFVPTQLEGAFVVEPEPQSDERGFFARLYCRQEFERQGVNEPMVQSSLSHNALPGTLRGMHFQLLPSREAKLVRCQQGRMFDVIVDLRPSSSTFMQHVGVELDSRSHNALYVPAGFAHGFQTLESNTDVLYMMTEYYAPQLSAGARFNDPAFGIDWPLPVSVIATRDREYPNFDATAYASNYLHALGSGDKEQ
ncbi:dTDP-4-dehydrorhamnose 3,5-epimerase [Halieaceae bacterium IMCC14734]|uniref:dTDP-4-dehydrorhamnose 3,5-epimerase n=1 Tax=Candidatus Litorirhabdus singularis TaxID=2518993 RepID=A0ABT3TFX7_9GAMM|nr:dTDP-4-dehydrorhamnose 3,5-epimerase [Candidatus Litorirhabdus singularis]MCX2980944.1 dTDP-4-dehydrorhamnose 3,5-epimerase [Candidatus Litorirhabdus singularis]